MNSLKPGCIDDMLLENLNKSAADDPNKKGTDEFEVHPDNMKLFQDDQFTSGKY